MKLTIGQIHDLLSGLAALEAPEVKLAGEVRLRIAINTNRIKPIAGAYESARTRAFADVMKETLSDNALQAAVIEANDKLRAVEEEVDLKPLTSAELKLDENPAIKGATLALLWPVLEEVK